MLVKQLAPKIYALEAATSTQVAQVMVRIQENYESPKFRNKVFTLDEFIPWYKLSRGRIEFTYFKDWYGFNAPGHVVKRFMSGKFDPLRPEERWLVGELLHLKARGRFYLLGYAAGDARVKKHELAHALFYTNQNYKREVLSALCHFDPPGSYAKHLLDTGYHQNVVVDEFHAWTLTKLFRGELWTSELDKWRDVLENIYQRYSEEL